VGIFFFFSGRGGGGASTLVHMGGCYRSRFNGEALRVHPHQLRRGRAPALLYNRGWMLSASNGLPFPLDLSAANVLSSMYCYVRAQPAMSIFYAYEPRFTCNVWVPDWWEKLCEACWKPGHRGEKDLDQDGGYIIFIELWRRTTLVGGAVHKRFANSTSLLSVRTRRQRQRATPS